MFLKEAWNAPVFVIAGALMLFTLTGHADDAHADNQEPIAIEPAPEDGPSYRVSRFELEYLRSHPLHPPLDEMFATPIALTETTEGFVAPRPDAPAVEITLREIQERGEESFFASAVQVILESLRDHLIGQELMGIYVAPDPDHLTEEGRDLRPAGVTELRILIVTGMVRELRTLASGERVTTRALPGFRVIHPDQRINHPLHQRIRDRSPIQPHATDEEQRDLLHRGELDRFLYHLSRYPGRRVDASVATAEEPGGIALDYLVTENRPLTFYLQFSNTGTPSTDYWRQRFGFFHTQLTNADDILSFDFTTSWFDKTNALLVSYERPFENDRIRWRLYGDWSEFTAAEVGFFLEDFDGRSWGIGGELIANVFQHRELFIDVAGGLRFQNVRVAQLTPPTSRGDENFVIPHIGARLDRTTEWASTQGALTLELGFTGASAADLETLGRVDADRNWAALHWAFMHGFYLEPIFNRAAWEDPTTPESSTLSHEVLLSFQGQYAFGRRLIPQQQQTAGGLYTVRGYPQSVVAGDTVILGTAEYRFHVPRAFRIEPEPRELFGRPFRLAPQYVYGRPDWDLVLKTFLDIGRTMQSDRQPFERDETLVGAGIGFELHFRRNLNVRVDWGFVLRGLAVPGVNSGSNRVHFVATLLY